MLIVSESGGSRYHRDAQPPAEGRTPLRIEPHEGRWLLVRYDFREETPLDRRRCVLSEHGTEKEAEQAAVAFVDGPAKAPSYRKGTPQSDKAKRVNARSVGMGR